MPSVRVLVPALMAALMAAGAVRADPVRYGLSPHADSILAAVGSDDHKGWYREEGLDVRFMPLQWRDIPDALQAGKIDMAIGSLAQVVASHKKDSDLVFWYGLGMLDNGFALLIRPNTGLKTVDQFAAVMKDRKQALVAAAEQLKGKSVVVSLNSELGVALDSIARDAGLHVSRDPGSDIKVVDLRPEAGLQVFLAHQGDAYLGPLLQRIEAEKAGMVEMLSGADFGAAPIVGILTTRTYAAHHKAELVKAMKVWFRTVNYTQSHQDEIGAIVVDELNKAKMPGFTATDFTRSWQSFEQYPLSPSEAAADILDPNGPNYWKTKQQECSAYFCSVAETSPEEDDSDKAFLMAEAQAAYVKQYGSKVP